ncbi:hypothetical protein [uncultured Cohaesibacter sp.]|uniref:capsular polysaccharide export protein, LipB/KpsS family n=1 Tax=uncultured Cohaesibacter sp. TaxID=1002546 RepID=UPI00292DDD2E|nr:hypothetical protein [uncultured Cohaesibacter sp.]
MQLQSSVNAMYSIGRLPELPQLALKLKERLGWEPTYWITQPGLEADVKSFFPDVITQDFTDANLGVNDPVELETLPVIDPGLLVSNGLLLRQGLEITARHVLDNSIRPDQQFNFYLNRLNYAFRVVKGLDLQVFVLASSPHCVADFAFYTAFKLLGRSIRYQHLTGFRGYQLVFDDVAAWPVNDLPPEADHDIWDDNDKELAKLLDDQSDNTPWYVTAQNERNMKHEKYYTTAQEIIESGLYDYGHVDFHKPPQKIVIAKKAKAAPSEITHQEPAPKGSGLFSRLKRGGASPSVDAPVPQPVLEEPEPHLVDAFSRKFQEKHSLELARAFAWTSRGFGRPNISWVNHYHYRDWSLLTKQRWAAQYEALTQDFNFDDFKETPYVFYALQYQPERTTSPEAGILSDQLFALQMIREAMPEDWHLLVKEHPSQFLWQTEGELGRWDGYYDQIQNLPRTTLVPTSVPSRPLIKSAKAVCTLTGTVGWEASLAGIPAICLAPTWYSTEGIVLPVANLETLGEAFGKIINGWRPDHSIIKDRIAFLQHFGRRCYINPSHAPQYDGLSEDMNAETLADLFVVNESRFTGAFHETLDRDSVPTELI